MFVEMKKKRLKLVARIKYQQKYIYLIKSIIKSLVKLNDLSLSQII